MYGALFMIIMAVLGKFGALFATIPEPIIGGVFIIMFAMVTAVGFSSLQFVDLNSTRNLFIVGFSIFIGLVVPKWFKLNPRAIDTGMQAFAGGPVCYRKWRGQPTFIVHLFQFRKLC